MKLIDSSGWIEFATDGPLARRYQAHLQDRTQLITPSIVLYEVYKRLRRDAGEGAADAIAAEMGKTLIVPLDDQLAMMAAEESLSHKLAMADAIVYATALAYSAKIITSDADFKGLPHVIYLRQPHGKGN
jgi:predicted nucleic acid-binding protein